MKQGWKVEKLGNVVTIDKIPNRKKNIPYVGLEHIESNTGKFIGSLEPQSVKSTTFNFSDKHVLYGRLRPYLNKVLLPDFEGHCSSEVFPLKVSDKVDRKFLFHWLLLDETASKINATSTGARMPRANMNHVLNFTISIPPIPEQERIVAVLDESFASIAQAKANAERNLVNARELFESFAGIAFENPGDWEVKSLGDVCSLYQGIAINAKTKHAIVEKSELPLLRIKDLRNNTVEQYIDPNNYPKNALVNESDLIYTRTGQIGLVFTGKRGVLHNNSFKIVPKSILSREYLFYWLQNPIFKTKIISLASRAAQPDITHELFKQQMISIPPLAEQRAIVGRLEALSAETGRLEAVYRQKVAALEELKKSVLQRAFEGEI
jgi:type I restriction enzyme S subunit